MRLFGFEITRTKASPVLEHVSDNRGGWWPWIREPYAGAWQRNEEWTVDSVLAHHAVYSCITRISRDVGKLRPMYVVKDENGIWSEQKNSAYTGVLFKPNRFQNHIQFKEWWIASKLIRGNTYVLKERNDRGGTDRGNVRALYILDPSRVHVLVAPDGSVFYQLGNDNLTGLDEQSVTVPASEIIHDRMNCLFHPLVGVSPIFASGLAAHIGNTIEKNSANFFGKGSSNSGVLTAPGKITEKEAEFLRQQWEQNYSGTDNAGKIAVLGGGLEFKALRMTAQESQLIEQLKWSAETVCSTFHVPRYKVQVGNDPTFQNAEIFDLQYYKDCLQSHIEEFEAVMDEGLGLDGQTTGVALDEDGLFRMDQASLYKKLNDGVSGGFLAPNEARRSINQPPVPGGDTPYLQQQNYSLAALDARDRAAPAPSDGGAPEPDPESPDEDEATVEEQRAFWEYRLKAVA